MLLDIRPVTIIADYFVICTGTSERQIKAIADDVQETVKKVEGLSPLHVEGTADSGWVLLDFGPIIVHLFSPEERERYNLEKLWSDAIVVLRML